MYAETFMLLNCFWISPDLYHNRFTMQMRNITHYIYFRYEKLNITFVKRSAFKQTHQHHVIFSDHGYHTIVMVTHDITWCNCANTMTNYRYYGHKTQSCWISFHLGYTARFICFIPAVIASTSTVICYSYVII